jgi:hypothetical protein
MFARFGNWFLRRGFTTNAEREREKQVEQKTRRRMSSLGMTFEVKCISCGKRFKRRSLFAPLRPHKGPIGIECYQTVGIQVFDSSS